MSKVIILDGGMGRELSKRDVPFRQPEWSALALMEAPEAVLQIHLDFIAAGADVITTNSYAVVPFHIGEKFYEEGEELAKQAAQLAHQAVIESGRLVKVAGCLPPLFGSYRPDLFDVEHAVEIVRPLICGQQDEVDIWLAETQSSIAEAEFVRQQLTDNKPVWIAFTLIDEYVVAEPALRSGETVTEAVQAMLALDIEAVLFNCSHPEVMLSAVQVARRVLDNCGSSMRLGVYANAFEPHLHADMLPANSGLDEIREDMLPLHYLDLARAWCEAGADIIGGCCGIGPEHIEVLANQLK